MTSATILKDPDRNDDTDALSGSQMYADVERYAAFGIHRFGTEADRGTTDWIAEELARAGLATEFQHFKFRKQYFLDSASVSIKGQTIEAMPFWWLPEDKASFTLSAPLAADDDSSAGGKIVWLQLPFDRAAYLDDSHRSRVMAAVARNPLAIILTIDNPSEEIFVYNVEQADAPWPLPVVVVAGKNSQMLADAQRNGTTLDIAVRGHYGHDVAGRNVIGRLDRKAKKTVVISTPMTGWFTVVGERAPGIAGFLAMARLVGASQPNLNFVFIATAGHEVSHGGMELFLHHGAPRPTDTLAWIHFGASVACREWTRSGDTWITNGKVDPRRLLVSSPSADALTAEAFAGLALTRFLAETSAPGELREVRAAGYVNFFGMASRHHLFHNPMDSTASTSAEILEPTIRAFARAIDIMATQQDAAFTKRNAGNCYADGATP